MVRVGGGGGGGDGLRKSFQPGLYEPLKALFLVFFFFFFFFYFSVLRPLSRLFRLM